MSSDAIVIGAGFAGLSLAARAVELGLKPLVLEQSVGEDYPCNSRYSGGHIHTCMDDPMAGQDYIADRIERMTGGLPDRELARTFASDGPNTLAWLRGHGVKFIRVGNDPGRQWVMAPPRRGQPGLDWKGRGPDETLRRLGELVRRGGGEIRFGVKATGLIIENGRCAGVTTADNAALRAKAVAIADGGFQGDLDLVGRYISPAPKKVMQRNAGTGRGDGFRMAEAAGAKMIGMDSFYGHPLARDAFTNDLLWPHPYLDAMAVTGIVVADDGKRFVDEGLGGVFIANTVARRPNPLDATVIYDHAVWTGPAANSIPPNPNPTLEIAKAKIHSAASIEELAREAGLPADRLAETVAEYNASISKGALATLPIPRTADRYKPFSIVKPPFYAVPMCAGITYTMGGPAVDADARVLHRDGHAIAGLYAVGSATGGLEGGPQVGYVGGLIKAFTLGMKAAQSIATTQGLRSDLKASA
jgi:fumarate reductase flavoprotein subunit